MRRWQQDRERMIRRWRIEIAKHEQYPHMALAVAPPDHCDTDDCHCYRGMGYFRKRHPFDCGKTRCGLCHWYKHFPGSGRANRRRAAIEFDIMASL